MDILTWRGEHRGERVPAKVGMEVRIRGGSDPYVITRIDEPNGRVAIKPAAWAGHESWIDADSIVAYVTHGRHERTVRASGRRQQHLPGIEPGIEPLEIEVPTMDWEQIGGDMDPGAHGGIIATGNGRAIELIEIQPVREHVGDREAADVGFPFWTKQAYFDAEDLSFDSPDVRDALRSVGLEQETLETMTPTQRAVAIAEALLQWGRGDEGPAGWSGDIEIPEKVKWWGGKVAGSEYIADEDESFVRDVLLGNLDIDHESFGPNEDEPESGLRVVVRGTDVEITEWTDIEAANGQEQPEGERVVRQDARVDLDELLDPKGPHRGTYSRDRRDVTLLDVAKMDPADQEEAIVAAAIAYIGYHGGDEEFVDAVGD